MTQKLPILIWRLKDAPLEVEGALIADGFFGNEVSYRQWRGAKTGDEFVVMIPENHAFDDLGIASDLGLNVTERMRALDFSGEHNPDCEAFAHLHYGESEEGQSFTYDAYVIPSLSGRDPAPAPPVDE